MRGVPNTLNDFWQFVSKADEFSGDTACWNWLGGIDADGYGRFPFQGRNTKAHRHAWSLGNSGIAIPEGMLVCHRCDNRRCCKPSHLYLGTVADNARDRSVAGSQTGSRNGWARLNEESVRWIKRRLAAGEPVAWIAADYGVTPGTVYFIRNGRNWKQVAA